MSNKRRFTHLSERERTIIEIKLSEGCKLRAIARSLQRAPSTISREIARDRPVRVWEHLPAPSRPYCGLRAQARADVMRAKARRRKRLHPRLALWPRVLRCLAMGLSPRQTSLTLGRMKPVARISHESIYQALYAMPKGDLRRQILALLPRGHKSRHPRSGGEDRRRGLIAGMTSIDERPIEVNERLLPGHWEGDLIKGAANASQIGTLVERSTLFTLLVQVPQATAAQTANAFAGVLKRVDAQMRLSLTYDQGKEMAHHQHLSRQTGMKVYFAHPRSPWERGINENVNGQLRRYFPKGSDLSVYTQEELDRVAMDLNAKPRASLNGKCPAELFLPETHFDFQSYWQAKLNPVKLVAFVP